MRLRYSGQSYAPSNLAFEPRDKDQIPPGSGSDNSARSATAQMTSFIARITAYWCLVLHGVLSVGIAIIILFGVQGRHFNVTERAPLVQVVGGARVTRFLPTQSDVVTTLSGTIAILKFILSAWAATLCWNIALFLMERRGLTRRDLKALLNYGLLTPGSYTRDWPVLIIGVLLSATLVGHLSSPILTGSISWISDNRLVRDLSIDPVAILGVGDHSLREFPPFYYKYPQSRQVYVLGALGKVASAWDANPEKGVLKRVLTEFNTLSVNSTADNILVPQFQVHSIRWIENRDEIPGIRDGVNPDDMLNSYFTMAPGSISTYPPGYAILIPNVAANWSSDPFNSTIIRDTRLLVLNYRSDEPTGTWVLTPDLPADAYILPHNQAHLAFAWVTFSAGVGRCRTYNCVTSAPSIIRNNAPLDLEPHRLTFQALSMAPVLGAHLTSANASLPSAWDNLGDYVEAVLVRSYSGAWMSMNSNFLRLPTASDYTPSLSNLLAQIDHWRLYTWLAIQLLVTALSVPFLVAQSRLSEYPLIVDTSLTAFDLDTTTLPVADVGRAKNRMRKIELLDDRLVVKVK